MTHLITRNSVWRSIFSSVILGACASSTPPQPPDPLEDKGQKRANSNKFEERVSDSFVASEEKVAKAAKVVSGLVLNAHPNLAQRFTVQANGLNARLGPGLNFKKIGRFYKGQEVRVSQIQKDWAKLEDGKWLALAYLKLTPP